jgi:hypothetical protein
MVTRKLTWLLFLGVALFSYSSFARLGETKDEILKRYGAVTAHLEISTNAWLETHNFKDYSVSVYFKNNVSVAEIVKTINPRTFSDTERDSLMKDIGGEGEWKVTSAPGEVAKLSWENTKTKAMASVRVGFGKGDMLAVTTPEWFKEMVARTEKQQNKAKGF